VSVVGPTSPFPDYKTGETAGVYVGANTLVAVTSIYASEPGQGDLCDPGSVGHQTTTEVLQRRPHQRQRIIESWPSIYEQEVQRETTEAQKAEQELQIEQANLSAEAPSNRMDGSTISK